MDLKKIEEKMDTLEKGLETLSAIVMEHEHSSPVSQMCEEVLKSGPVCTDAYKAFVEQRRYVLCKAFKALEDGEVKTFSEGIRKGWKEVHEKCK